MKRLTLITIVALNVFLFGCDSSDKDVISESEIKQQEIFEEHGIKPSDADLINNVVNVVDNDGYKLAYGRKNNKAWFAKFKNNGEQIYSYEMESEKSKEYKYSHCNSKSNLLISNGKIFIGCNLTNENDPNAAVYSFNTVLVVLDFESGLEISKLESKEIGSVFRNIREEENFYFIECTDWNEKGNVYSFHVFYPNGTLVWERDTEPGLETNLGIEGYKLHYFLNRNEIVYGDNLGIWNADYGYEVTGILKLKTLNLKDYELLKKNELAFISEHKDKEVVFFIKSLSPSGDKIEIVINEVEEITDDISGVITYKLIETHKVLY